MGLTVTHLETTGAPVSPVSPARLAVIALRTARHPEQWLSQVRYDVSRRWYQRLLQHEDYEIWLLSWLPGQETGFHDHGISAGAFAVAQGSLDELTAAGDRPTGSRRTFPKGAVHSFSRGYVHNVRNEAVEPALSIHAYSPPLISMRRFAIGPDGQLRMTVEERSW